MSNRLTWQNVDAPNLDRALANYTGGGQAFQTAMGDISSLFTGIDARKKATLNASAMEKLLQHQDVGGWDEALKQHGFGALGIRPDQASPELLELISGRRNALEEDRTSDLTYRTDSFTQGVTERSDARTEEERARGLAMQELVDGMASQARSPEQLAKMIRDRGLGTRDEQAAYAAAGLVNPSEWAVSPDTEIANPDTVRRINEISGTLDRGQRDLEYMLQSNPALALSMDASSRYEGYDSPSAGMIERLGATVSDENKERFGKSKGEVQNHFNALKRDEEFKDIPDHIIAAVMENNLRGTGLGWLFDSNVKFDNRAIKAELRQFATQEARDSLFVSEQDYRARSTAIADDRARLERAQGELLIAIDKGAPASEITKLQERITSLHDKLGIEAPAVPTPPPTETPPPAEDGAAVVDKVLGAVDAPPAATEVNPAVDPRVASASSAFIKGVGGVGRALDRGVGYAAQSPLMAYEPFHRGVGYAVGAIGFPETGSEIVRGADALRSFNQGLRTEGLMSDGAAPAVPPGAAAAATVPDPAPVAREAVPFEDTRAMEAVPAQEVVLRDAMASPEAGLQLVGESANLAPEAVNAAVQSLGLLQSPDAPLADKEAARRQLRQFITQARRNGADLPNELQLLIQQANTWLPLS